MYNEIKRELYATDRECEICSNQISHGRAVAVFWLSNVQKVATRMMHLKPFDLTA